MEATAIQTPAARQHKKTTSSVLKSMMAPRHHQRNPSLGLTLRPGKSEDINLAAMSRSPMLPRNHPHARQQLQEEISSSNNVWPSPTKSIEIYDDSKTSTGLHKKTKSSVSLKSLMGTEKAKVSTSKSSPTKDDKNPKKSKSSTNLAALLSRPKSSKGTQLDGSPRKKDKENRTPPSSATTAPPPIWAQFSSQQILEPASTTKVPLNDRELSDHQVSLYTPRDRSPSKQRNLCGYNQPTLSPKLESRARPKSAYLPSGPSTASFAETLSRLRKPVTTEIRESPSNAESSCKSQATSPSRRSSSEHRRVNKDSSHQNVLVSKRGSRVMAAVAAFNENLKEREVMEPKFDAKAIENAFENFLDSRNIPQNTRDKMRSLDTNMKAHFIKHHESSSGSTSSTEGLQLKFPDAQMIERPSTGQRSGTDVGAKAPGTPIGAESPKKSRPRSRTFTFSKGDCSPSKKQKAERPISQGPSQSGDRTSSDALRSLTSAGGAPALSFLSKVPKPTGPEDFISYLRKTQKPQLVEVGRLHKLRQLLRNETVSWVDVFIAKGGMIEIVGLLYRIIEVEWREEHEDALLHETLLCLKALCTTSLALEQLCKIQTTLFPTLLAMLFDEEKKGPSEFTTRSIIFSLLFTHLSTSPRSELASCARIILSYLRDTPKPEKAQPPGFIASIYHPRPYRTWCKEVVNVTKEVFWIFLHHFTVIPFPADSDPNASYTATHFPRERPPVPAAPYVGGVEWEATNYLAAHLDLMNGIIASLPNGEERNNLRQELQDSGFEKCMGTNLRTCKEKFYGSVHAGLTTWIGAAREDGWAIDDVKDGPKREQRSISPKKGKRQEPPKLEMPKLDLGPKAGVEDGGWL